MFLERLLNLQGVTNLVIVKYSKIIVNKELQI